MTELTPERRAFLEYACGVVGAAAQRPAIASGMTPEEIAALWAGARAEVEAISLQYQWIRAKAQADAEALMATLEQNDG